MLRKVESTSDVNHGLEPCQSGIHAALASSPGPSQCWEGPGDEANAASPFQLYVQAQVVSQIDDGVRAYAHVHDDHYLTRSKI